MALFLRRTTNIIKHFLVTKSSLATNQTSLTPSFFSVSHNVCSKSYGLAPIPAVFRRMESTKAAELKLDPQFYSSEEEEDDREYPSSEPEVRITYRLLGSPGCI